MAKSTRTKPAAKTTAAEEITVTTLDDLIEGAHENIEHMKAQPVFSRVSTNDLAKQSRESIKRELLMGHIDVDGRSDKEIHDYLTSELNIVDDDNRKSARR